MKDKNLKNKEKITALIKLKKGKNIQKLKNLNIVSKNLIRKINQIIILNIKKHLLNRKINKEYQFIEIIEI